MEERLSGCTDKAEETNLRVKENVKNKRQNRICGKSGTLLKTRLQHSGGGGRWISEFGDSLVYKSRSRTAEATKRKPVSSPLPPIPQKTKNPKDQIYE